MSDARKKCAYLTMPDPADFVTDYDVSFDAMSARGWDVETVPWRGVAVDWHRFDAVYICTPWDYPQHLERFIAVLEDIESSSALLVNELSLVRWNLNKIYLRDLAARGADIVPSLWFDDIDETRFSQWFQLLAADKVVIKPAVGANANDTFVLEDPLPGELRATLAKTFRRRQFFIQPFVESIRTEGEYSLFYLGGEYSHAIQKVPKAGDFRVQEEHGADIRSVKPGNDLLATGQAVLSLVIPEPVYARIDFVRDNDDRFLLMELELIEPSLYLRMDAGAAQRFAAAFDRHYRESQ